MAGSILNVLYALNLTDISYVLYLLLRFLDVIQEGTLGVICSPLLLSTPALALVT